MGFLSSLFGGGGSDFSGFNAANQYLEKIPGMEKEYFDPYIKRGSQAYDAFSPQLESMMKDPASFLSSIQEKYQPSKAYQLQRDEALRSAANTAAAGGMRGSPQDIGRSVQLTDRLMGQDMQQWLNNVLGLQQRGMAGEQNLYGMGYDASKSLAGDLSNIYGQQAQYAFQQDRENRKRDQDLFSGIGSALGTIGSWIF